MIDKTIPKTTFDPPIYSGKVIKYNSEKMSGIIRTENGDEVFFKYSLSENEIIQVEDKVIYSKYPFIQSPDKYYAKNIRKAYESKDGYLITDDKWSHVHEGLKKELPKMIQRISCNGRGYFYEKLWYEYIIGTCSCVPITWEDEIVFAIRVGRDKYSKFVKNRKCIPTHYITIYLKQKQNIYLIKSCYYGEELADADLYNFEPEYGERVSFWNDHALVLGSEPIYPETLTSICPWTGIDEKNRFGSLFKNFNSDFLERRA